MINEMTVENWDRVNRTNVYVVNNTSTFYMEDSHMKASESSFMYVFFQQSMSTTVEWNLRQKIVYS